MVRVNCPNPIYANLHNLLWLGKQTHIVPEIELKRIISHTNPKRTIKSNQAVGDAYVCAKELRALSTQFSHDRTNIDFFLQSQLLH